jgi:hypothetical protein
MRKSAGRSFRVLVEEPVHCTDSDALFVTVRGFGSQLNATRWARWASVAVMSSAEIVEERNGAAFAPTLLGGEFEPPVEDSISDKMNLRHLPCL